VHRIECDDRAVLDAEFGQQRLRRRNFVGFFRDIDMGEHEGRVGGERAQHLGGGAVVETIEASAQRLSIQRDAALPGLCTCSLKQRGMLAEDVLDVGGIEPLEDVADRGVSRRTTPRQTEGLVQPAAMDIDEGDDASIRVAAGHDGKDGEQQHVGKLVLLALATAGIGNARQQAQQRRECVHGNLRLGCRPRSQTFADS